MRARYGVGLRSQGIGVVFFWWLNLVRLYSLYKIQYPKRGYIPYSILGTVVSPITHSSGLHCMEVGAWVRPKRLYLTAHGKI